MLEEFKAIRKRFPNALPKSAQHHPQDDLGPLYKEQGKCLGTSPNWARGWEEGGNKPPPVITHVSSVRIAKLQAQD